MRLLKTAFSITLFAPVLGFELKLTNGDIKPDGVPRRAITPNGGVIGPLIKFSKNENFQVNVVNNLTDPTMRRSTSIHWHGFHQRRTNAQDGASFVTQCPIAPGDSFNYTFPTRNQTGTFWYHSHLSTQYCDGLRGPIVIRDPQDPQMVHYDFDDDATVITIADHYHETAPRLQRNWFRDLGPAPPANSTLINGVGRFDPNNTAIAWPVFNVKSGKKYRFRFVNVACDSGFRVSIEGHSLKIIEADAEPTEPFDVQGFEIYPGQRYSAVLTADQDSSTNYWIFVDPITTPGFNTSSARGILRYNSNPVREPPQERNNPPPFVFREENLRNAEFNSPGLGGNITADETLRFNITLLPNSSYFAINGKTFSPPAIPALLQILKGARDPADFIPAENLITLKRNQLIELVFTTNVPITHPFHLHGHSFDVIKSSGSNDTNFVNPVRRDVTTMIGGNTFVIRFRTDNPGPWFLHCHIDWHLESGLALIFGEALADNVQGPDKQIIPLAWEDLCPAYEALSPELQ